MSLFHSSLKGGFHITVHKVLNTIHGAIKNQPKIPLTNIILIDRERILDLIEKIRTNLPEEIRQAKWITKESQQLIENAKEKSEKIISEAREKAALISSEEEILKEAQTHAKDIVRRSREEEINIVRGADQYADEILSCLEEELNKLMIIIQK